MNRMGEVCWLEIDVFIELGHAWRSSATSGTQKVFGILYVQITSEEGKTISSCSEYSYHLRNNKSYLTKRKLSNAEHRFNQTRSTSDRPRAGRPHVTSPREDSHIRLRYLRDRFLCATVTARTFHGLRIIAQTVRNRLKFSRLRPRRPYTGPVLTQRHRASRLNWARSQIVVKAME